MSNRDDLKSKNIEFMLEEQEEPIGLKWKKLISRVLQRIPNDVVARVYELAPRFLVLEKGRVASTKFVSDFANPEKDSSTDDEERTARACTIIINEAQMDILPREDQLSTIAAQIAHVYLEHKALNNKLLAARFGKSKFDLKSEIEAAKLIEQWGFKFNPM